MTSSPGEVKFTTADSIAPVPEDAKKITSPVVPKRGLQPASNLARSSVIWGERWLNNGRSPAARTGSGTCIGPGSNSNGLRINAPQRGQDQKHAKGQNTIIPNILSPGAGKHFIVVNVGHGFCR